MRSYLLRHVYLDLVLMQRFFVWHGIEIFNKSRTIQQLICLWPSVERAQAWQMLGQNSSAFCGCASDWVLIELRRGLHNVWLWAHLVAQAPAEPCYIRTIIEVCVLQRRKSTHAEIRVCHLTKNFNKFLNDWYLDKMHLLFAAVPVTQSR